MSLRGVSAAELAVTMAQMGGARERLMRFANELAAEAGFQERDARFMAVTSLCLGAAQMNALSVQAGTEAHYEIFQAMCAVMAATSARAAIQSSVMELGPEASPAGLVGFQK